MKKKAPKSDKFDESLVKIILLAFPVSLYS